MENLDFSEEEIQEQLEILGYTNISKHKLREFKRDLDELIQHGEWERLVSPTQKNSTKSQRATTQPSPPAFTKEKVRQSYIEDSGKGFFLHADKADDDGRVLTACQNKDYGGQQAGCDSYAKHSVALKLQLPPGAPSRLQVEPNPDDTLHPPLTNSYTSSPDTQGSRFIKRKVLRKHKGQSLVCDESVYSEDSALCLHRQHITHTSAGVQVATMYKMYNTQWDDDESDDDKNSLASSFWSDGERQRDEEEDEKVEMEQVISEKDSKPVSNAEDSVQEASEEKKTELDSKDNQERSDNDNNDKNEDEDDEDENEDEEESEDEDEDNENENAVYDENVDEENDDEDTDTEVDDESDDDDENEDDKVEDEDNENEDDLDKNENVVEENEVDDNEKDDLDKNENGVDVKNKDDDNKNKDNHNENEDEEDDNKNEDEENKGDDNDHENYENEEDDEDKSCNSSSDSPAPSLMTSGYGTYRPEEQDGGDYRDDHTITEFDQDSRADLSEMRDDEDVDHSLYSFGGFDVEPTEFDCSETLSSSFLADAESEARVDFGRDVGLHEGMNLTDMTSEDKELTYEEKLEEDPHALCENEVINTTLDEQQHAEMKDTFVVDEKQLEGGSVNVEERKQNERLEEAVQDLQTENKMKKEDKVESGESDESSSNKDIKFIDSKLDFRKMTFDKICEDWEGNLRAAKDVDSRLEERLAELNLLTSARPDFECEDATSHSTTERSDTGEISMSAFESYIRGMTQDQCDSYIRPKPKSFIRPVMSQQAIKKTDPVAKYFRYKQFWEMFKLPGERDRRALRLEIKERLTYQPPPPKPRRVYVPNDYIVPTEKKRSALRWEIRNDLANGLMPCKYSY